MFASRRISAAMPRALASFPRSSFHSTSRAFVKTGDSVPDVELMENSPGNKVNLAKELKGKGLIIGVPAAFSKATRAFLLHQGGVRRHFCRSSGDVEGGASRCKH
ncbi:hypothetical protein BJ546DRAFT_676428 [Cryomyces antarcticus]